MDKTVVELSDTDLLAQVQQQYRAVAHLAGSLMRVHLETLNIMDHLPRAVIELEGKRSAHIMETLGNVLNDMEAIDDTEDAWTHPVFATAQKLFGKR